MTNEIGSWVSEAPFLFVENEFDWVCNATIPSSPWTLVSYSDMTEKLLTGFIEDRD